MLTDLVKILTYPIKAITISKNMVANVKPKKCTPPPKAKFMVVATNPTIVKAPSFLIHQLPSINKAKPIRSLGTAYLLP